MHNDWLDYATHPVSGGSVTTLGNTLLWPTWTDWTANYVTYYPTYTTTARKITLKLSEVMYLRECAAEDKKLRKVLKKFAPHIEITVDFPG